MTYQVNSIILGISDPRDYLYIQQGDGDYPPAVDLAALTYEVEDQAQWGTCGPNMSLAWEEARAKREGQVLDLSRLYVYRRARELTGLPPEQEGVVLRDMFRAERNWGVPPEVLWPYEESYLTSPIPPSVDAVAALTKLERYEAIFSPRVGPIEKDERVDLIKDALNQGLWVLLGLTVTNDIRLMEGPWRTHTYRKLGPSMPAIGGHAVVIVGYDDAVGKFKFLNSWGSNWGDSGYGGFPYSVVNEYGCEAWVSRKFGTFYDREPVGIRLEYMNKFSIQARIVPPVELIGTEQKLWIGVYDPVNGQWYYSPSLNQFLPFPDGIEIPHHSVITLGDTYEDIWVVRDFDYIIGGTGQGLTPYKGWEVWIAYGQSPSTWIGDKILTIPWTLT